MECCIYRITSKHFDYVLCSKDTLAVVAVIELDDRSHNLRKTYARDVLLRNRALGLKNYYSFLCVKIIILIRSAR
ncbi:MAG: DUF2726 domain-containing protein [Saprospiraceae bacterium]|nr:DUF2726 domain-containing protein [Candidatus Brachybacter algidus]